MPSKACPNCGGDGWVNGRGGHHVRCPRCQGSGIIIVAAIGGAGRAG